MQKNNSKWFSLVYDTAYVVLLIAKSIIKHGLNPILIKGSGKVILFIGFIGFDISQKNTILSLAPLAKVKPSFLKLTHVTSWVCFSKRQISFPFTTQRFLYKDYVLYICTWDKNFYVLDLFNTQIHQSQKLTADPISISLYKEDYVIVGTNNREINLFNKEGYFVTTITQGINSWVTSLKNFDKYSSIISASNEGSLICIKLLLI